MDLNELEEEINKRQNNEKEIREKINNFCWEYYKIPEMTALIDELFFQQKNFSFCLARQIPTVNIEHIAKRIFIEWLNFQGFECGSIAMSFFADSLTYKNPTKVSYVRRPVFFRGRKGNIVIQNEYLVKNRKVEGAILGKIITDNGLLLVDFHKKIRTDFFGSSGPEVDISEMLKKILRHSIASGISGSAPTHVFIEDGIKEKLISVSELNGHCLNRPPKDWYYMFHFFAFVDGRRALFSRIGDDPKMAATFKSAEAKIEEITGFKPLIVDTPDIVSVEGVKFHLDEVPRWVFQDVNWRNKIAPPRQKDFFEVIKHFEMELIR